MIQLPNQSPWLLNSLATPDFYTIRNLVRLGASEAEVTAYKDRTYTDLYLLYYNGNYPVVTRITDNGIRSVVHPPNHSFPSLDVTPLGTFTSEAAVYDAFPELFI